MAHETEGSELAGDRIVLDVERLYRDTSTARMHRLSEYERKALELAGEGNEVLLTGRGPIWLYLRVAHALHGVTRRLLYRDPKLDAPVEIFDHRSE